MSGGLGKLGFVHRTLWRQDGFYRISVLLGPAALAGLAVAAAAWWGGAAWWGAAPLPHGAARAAPAWAVPRGNDEFWASGGAPIAMPPLLPLPPSDGRGGLRGFLPGWQMYTAPLQADAIDVTVLPDRPTVIPSHTPGFDMAAIKAQAPPGQPLYVGVGYADLVVRAAGIYGVTARLERPAAATGTCLTRLVFVSKRVISNVDVGLIDDTRHVFDPIQFQLTPGLYPIALAFGCWQGAATGGPGRITVMIGHPGSAGLVPATGAEIVHLAPPQN